MHPYNLDDAIPTGTFLKIHLPAPWFLKRSNSISGLLSGKLYSTVGEGEKVFLRLEHKGELSLYIYEFETDDPGYHDEVT